MPWISVEFREYECWERMFCVGMFSKEETCVVAYYDQIDYYMGDRLEWLIILRCWSQM